MVKKPTVIVRRAPEQPEASPPTRRTARAVKANNSNTRQQRTLRTTNRCRVVKANTSANNTSDVNDDNNGNNTGEARKAVFRKNKARRATGIGARLKTVDKTGTNNKSNRPITNRRTARAIPRNQPSSQPKSKTVVIKPNMLSRRAQKKTEEETGPMILFDSDEENDEDEPIDSDEDEQPVSSNTRAGRRVATVKNPPTRATKQVQTRKFKQIKPTTKPVTRPATKPTTRQSRFQRKKPIQQSKAAKKSQKDIYQQSVKMIYQCDPEQDCSREELLERLEYKQDQLKELLVNCQENPREARAAGHRPEDIEEQIDAIEHVLQNLHEVERKEQMSQMNAVRDKQDLIVKKRVMKKEHFAAKINLTADSDEELGEDEQLVIFRNSRKLFEKIKHYQDKPKDLRNPFKRGRACGNRKMPQDAMKLIEQKFAV